MDRRLPSGSDKGLSHRLKQGLKGLWALTFGRLGQTENRLVVLTYHKIGDPPPESQTAGDYVNEQSFKKQMDTLDRLGWEAVTLDQVLDWMHRETPLPPRSFLLTFDDASESVHHHALPILDSKNWSCVLFVPTAFVGQQSTWDAEDGDPGTKIMSRDQLFDAAQSGHTLGSHGDRHTALGELPQEQAVKEITRSLDCLYEVIGERPSVLSYPFGSINRLAAAEAGITAAFTIDKGAARPDTHKLMIPRVNVGRHAGPWNLLLNIEAVRAYF